MILPLKTNASMTDMFHKINEIVNALNALVLDFETHYHEYLNILEEANKTSLAVTKVG